MYFHTQISILILCYRKNILENLVENNEPIELRKALVKEIDVLSKSRALCTAAKTMNLECVEILLNAGANILTKFLGRNALYHAVRNGNVDILQMMLDKVDVLAADAALKEALFEAAANGTVASVEILLKRGIDVNCPHYHDSEFVSMCPPLVAACYGPFMLRNYTSKFSDTAKLLIESGARLDAKDTYSDTALHWAAFNQLDEVINLMAEKNVEINVVNGIGKTPLMSCIEGLNHHGMNSSEALDILISKGADINSLDYDNFSALHYAILASAESVERVLKAGALPDLEIDYVGLGTVTALGMAILEHSWESMKHLVLWNANVNIPCFTSGRWIPFVGVCDAAKFPPQHAVFLALAGSDQWQMRKQLLVVHKDQLESIDSDEKRLLWQWLLEYASKPRSLRELCRLQIRERINKVSKIRYLNELELPQSVLLYLQFSDL